MSSVGENNRRIARNTLVLYFRTIVTMLVTLFTSRIILNALGLVDYGLNSVVTGVITLFTFIKSSVGDSTIRFLAFELECDKTDKLQDIFRISFNIHVLLAIIVVVFCETIGLWIVNNVLIIPSERLFACNMIYQFVIVSAMFSIVQVPFYAMIIAHESMNVFAYIGITNAFLSLGIAFLVSISSFDKLILLSFLNTLITIGIYSFYHLYCKQKFKEYNLGRTMDKPLLREMLVFSGWNMFGASVGVIRNAGVNILINSFFGPLVNSAFAISHQVNQALNSFYSNFTLSLNPQIVKSYSVGDISQMRTLLLKGGKFSFFLLMIFVIPLIIETDMILYAWLKNVPQYAVIFTRLILLFALTDCFTSTVGMAIQATGKMKYYQSVVGGILLLAFPIIYTCYKLGSVPEFAFYAIILTSIFAIGGRLFFLKNYLKISPIVYFKDVLLNSIIVFILSIAPPYFVSHYMSEGYLRLLVVVCVSLFCSLCFIYQFGLNFNERKIAVAFIKHRILKYE